MVNNVRKPAFTIAVGALAFLILLAPFSISQAPVNELKGTPAGWSDDINISNSPQRDVEPAIAVYNDIVHIIWRHNFASTRDIVYTKSTDGGHTWSPNVSLGSSIDLTSLPDISLYENNIHVVWYDTEGWDGIYYRNSTDSGETWNPTKRISSDGVDAGGPHIFVNNTNTHIIWRDERDGSDGEIYYRRSLDGGISFDNGQGLDEDRRVTFSPADVTAIDLAGSSSDISATWLDERNGIWEVYWMISKDNGFTWEDGLGNVGQDRRLTTTGAENHAIAVNGPNIHIVYVDPVDITTYYLYYINSTDNGMSWNTAVQLAGPVPGINSPDIDVQGNNISVVWDDERDDGDHEEIYYKNSSDGGITWSDDLRLTYNLSSSSYWPRITVAQDNKHVVWYEKNFDGTDYEIYYKRYPDFPDLSPPDHSNEIPPPESYKDAPGTNVSVHVTDPSGVNESTIQLWINGSLVSHTLTSITDGFNVSYESPGFSPGVIECRIVADDNYSNQLDFTWNFTVLALYEIELHEGWNLISVPHVQVDTAIDEVLRDIDGKWDYIQWYDAANGEWKSNATFKPQQLNDLFYLNRSMAFWINITEPNVNLTVRGHRSAYTEIPLYAGWNFVGYPSLSTETVGNALWGTGADRVEVYDGMAPYRIKEVGPTYIMKTGEGYWVHVPADTVWVIDW